MLPSSSLLVVHVAPRPMPLETPHCQFRSRSSIRRKLKARSLQRSAYHHGRHAFDFMSTTTVITFTSPINLCAYAAPGSWKRKRSTTLQRRFAGSRAQSGAGVSGASPVYEKQTYMSPRKAMDFVTQWRPRCSTP
uniref:Uncharacterized protein n=1 Tax=Mycena chlorophos TaxID=658473 RepID=A0ABQ0LDS5_MYCCL|nr:predicted protein [Mycena chlorophos]